MKLTKTAPSGVQRVETTFITDELQKKLSGLNLADAQEKGLITAIKFVNVNKAYTFTDGHVEDHDNIDLVTDKGNVRLSTSLAKHLEGFEDRLGDLVFKQFPTDPAITGRASVIVFRLQKPGGNVVETVTDLAIGQ